jgi:hypothetical protein
MLAARLSPDITGNEPQPPAARGGIRTFLSKGNSARHRPASQRQLALWVSRLRSETHSAVACQISPAPHISAAGCKSLLRRARRRVLQVHPGAMQGRSLSHLQHIHELALREACSASPLVLLSSQPLINRGGQIGGQVSHSNIHLQSISWLIFVKFMQN